MEFDTEKYIYEIENRPPLWNMKSKEYSDRILKIKMWEEIVDIFGGKEMTTDEKKNLDDHEIGGLYGDLEPQARLTMEQNTIDLCLSDKEPQKPSFGLVNGSLRIRSGSIVLEAASLEGTEELMLDIQLLSKKIQCYNPSLKGKQFVLTYKDLHESQLEYVFLATTKKIKYTESTGSTDRLHCSECKGRIVGFHHRCVSCKSYELCPTCEALGFHREHVMLRLTRPTPLKKIRELINNSSLMNDKSKEISEKQIVESGEPRTTKTQQHDRPIPCKPNPTMKKGTGRILYSYARKNNPSNKPDGTLKLAKETTISLNEKSAKSGQEQGMDILKEGHTSRVIRDKSHKPQMAVMTSHEYDSCYKNKTIRERASANLQAYLDNRKRRISFEFPSYNGELPDGKISFEKKENNSTKEITLVMPNVNADLCSEDRFNVAKQSVGSSLRKCARLTGLQIKPAGNLCMNKAPSIKEEVKLEVEEAPDGTTTCYSVFECSDPTVHLKDRNTGVVVTMTDGNVSAARTK